MRLGVMHEWSQVWRGAQERRLWIWRLPRMLYCLSLTLSLLPQVEEHEDEEWDSVTKLHQVPALRSDIGLERKKERSYACRGQP